MKTGPFPGIIPPFSGIIASGSGTGGNRVTLRARMRASGEEGADVQTQGEYIIHPQLHPKTKRIQILSASECI